MIESKIYGSTKRIRIPSSLCVISEDPNGFAIVEIYGKLYHLADSYDNIKYQQESLEVLPCSS